MTNQEFVYDIIKKLCELGQSRDSPNLYLVEPFKPYFSENGELKYDELDDIDGRITRREILTRYLLLNVVLDQGPDMKGVSKLLKDVVTSLYRREVKIFHRPLDFFRDLGHSIDEVLDKHNSVKEFRALEWARENDSTPSRYNLFFAQSSRGLISTKQVLDYTIHRWGVPLCVPLLLERDLQKVGKESPQPLVDYLESWESAEIMAQHLKDDARYGLGSAIGNKACHLFAKMYVSVFKLVKHKTYDSGWKGCSYEVPFDSNAGRVLFRTGFLTEWATLSDYVDWNVIQRGKGKGGTDYIRVTNIRGKKTQNLPQLSIYFSDYVEIVTKLLKTASKPRSVEIQRVPNIVYRLMKDGHNYSMADFDDGLMYIGTKYCFNHESPNCLACPARDLCKGYNEDRSLIEQYTT